MIAILEQWGLWEGSLGIEVVNSIHKIKAGVFHCMNYFSSIGTEFFILALLKVVELVRISWESL